jgi:hypothetical protein
MLATRGEQQTGSRRGGDTMKASLKTLRSVLSTLSTVGFLSGTN